MDGGNHVGSRAAKQLLQLLAQHRRNAVHLDLRVAIVHYTVGVSQTLGLFKQTKEAVKIGIVVIRQVDAVGIQLQIVTEKAEAVVHRGRAGHLKTLAHSVKHHINVNFFYLFFFFLAFGKRGEM